MNPKTTFMILSSLVCAVFALTPNALKVDFETVAQKTVSFDNTITAFSTNAEPDVFAVISIILATDDLSSAEEKITKDLGATTPAMLALSETDALDILSIASNYELALKHGLMLLVEKKPEISALVLGLSDLLLVPILRDALVRLSVATLNIGPTLRHFLPTDDDSSEMIIGTNFNVDFVEVLSAYDP
ncbi:hypothetical protein GALMADRAFT_147842 [Galerina marginata CBS 339.88]|uniref:Uncharacterized protein n=1 Tax=Galerina marginata (strain CBS 339.88) TaxID=685588 RepID=A0A067SFW5_GALM3|nr:hypothetical protein GALMADRAFT_147842 [Galerina marginata CBS 339.88]